MDQHYPRYHLRPQLNWVNDPNGMIFFKGRYHVFMQYNPLGPLWGNIHWLHYSSADLVNWINHGYALAPDQSYDQGGCWSGCAAIDDTGLPVLIYSADDGQKRRPAIAYGDDTAQHFVKYQNNPVISSPPLTGIHGFRDHKLFRWKNTWLQLIGSGNESQGMIFCYQSTDLHSWTYLGIWFEYKHLKENMLECPDLFEAEGRIVQIFSTNSPSEDMTCQSYYRIGSIIEVNEIPKFESEIGGQLDFDRMYAPQVLQDDTNRTILLGWIREDRTDNEIVAAGWAGAMSLPRHLKVDNIVDSTGEEREILRMYPVRELQRLRRAEKYNTHLDDIEWISQAEVWFHYKTEDIKNTTSINWQLSEHNKRLINLKIETDSGRVLITKDKPEKYVEFTYIPEDELIIHIFIDHSIVEIFINYSCCITLRIYPEKTIEGLAIEPNPTSMRMWQLADLNIGE